MLFLSRLALSLLALNNPSNESTATKDKIAQLESRLQMGYEAQTDAQIAILKGDYPAAASSFADALNFGRKSALTLHEMEAEDSDKALQWLIDLCCESATIHLFHLDDAAQARKDAWAACLFSQYTQRTPLELMKAVCINQDDLLGEMQACQQLLDLEELVKEDEEREVISDRLAEIKAQLDSQMEQ